MRFAGKALTVLFAIEISIVIAAFTLIAGLLLTDILMRQTGSGSLWGAQKISVYLMIIAGFLGLGLAAAKGRHLRPRFLDGVLPKGLHPAISRIGASLMALTFGCFGIIGLQFVADAFEYQDMARIIDIPMWTLHIIVPYAFFSTAVRYAIFAVYPALQPEEGESA